MKRLFQLLLSATVCVLLTSGVSVQNNGQPDYTVNQQGNAAQITFVKTEHDFGDIKEGQTVEYTFQFQNTGNAPLVIANVRTTCGCTATKWPREPIAPGEKGEITARFDSTGKYGMQTKIITIVSNASNPQEQIALKINILPTN